MDAPVISKDASKTPKDTATTLQDSLKDLELYLFSGQAPQSEARWHFLDLNDERVPATLKHAQSYLNHILQMKQEWCSERLELPSRWAQLKPRIFMGDRWLGPYNITLMTAPIRSIIDRLSNDDILDRQKAFSHKPDFCLAHFRNACPKIFNSSGNEVRLSYELYLTTSPCFLACADLMLYDGTESNA
ncbi:hypothetical protein CPB85DRAFT_597033 [Mucidula mucida]|nr:hypothetical protein CPB85DRAFT_597033 [Mucidula mucida]